MLPLFQRTSYRFKFQSDQLWFYLELSEELMNDLKDIIKIIKIIMLSQDHSFPL